MTVTDECGPDQTAVFMPVTALGTIIDAAVEVTPQNGGSIRAHTRLCAKTIVKRLSLED